jgi:hypothetical protein
LLDSEIPLLDIALGVIFAVHFSDRLHHLGRELLRALGAEAAAGRSCNAMEERQ